jgi:hypothetical protein
LKNLQNCRPIEISVGSHPKNSFFPKGKTRLLIRVGETICTIIQRLNNTLEMKAKIIILALLSLSTFGSFAQSSEEERQLMQLSKDKWQWMADKNVDKLEKLFDSKSKFVHMSGTWKKDEELEIIKSGSIWYKNAIVHDSALETFGTTAVVWNRITLEAIVRGTEAKNEFTVTEVYQKQGKDWKMLALTFSSVRDTHQIKK